MKDFFDVHALATRQSFDGQVLLNALRATFGRRHTEIPTQLPIAFTPAFAEVDGKRAQWTGFLRRNRLTTAQADLGTVVDVIAAFLWPVLTAARGAEGYRHQWQPGGPWKAVL